MSFTCDDQVLTLADGLWWPQGQPAAPSTPFYACASDRCTLVGNRTLPTPATYAAVKCAAGYTGVLCDECVPGLSVRATKQCVQCWSPLVNVSVLAAVAVAVAVFVIATQWSATSEWEKQRELERLAGKVEVVAAKLKRLHQQATPVSVLRVAINFSQLLSVIGLFRVRGPSVFRDIMGANDAAAGGNMMDAFPLTCLLGLTTPSRFFATMALPVGVIVYGVGFTTFVRCDSTLVAWFRRMHAAHTFDPRARRRWLTYFCD